MIIAAYAGTGKTMLANTCPGKFTDFVCMPYKYILPEDDDPGEAGKANPDNVMRGDWPYNYVAAIEAEMEKGKHLLIPTDMFVLMLLQSKNIPYVLCYPERIAKEAYRRRFMERGNTEQFINIFIGQWDERIAALERDTFGRHIVLHREEFLADVIDRDVFGLCSKI